MGSDKLLGREGVIPKYFIDLKISPDATQHNHLRIFLTHAELVISVDFGVVLLS